MFDTYTMPMNLRVCKCCGEHLPLAIYYRAASCIEEKIRAVCPSCYKLQTNTIEKKIKRIKKYLENNKPCRKHLPPNRKMASIDN